MAFQTLHMASCNVRSECMGKFAAPHSFPNETNSQRDCFRLACQSRKEEYPLSIRVRHEHVGTSGFGFPRIVNPHLATVVGRKDLATGVVFEWCDGYRSSIADAVHRMVRRQVEIRPLAMCSLEEARLASGEPGKTLAEVLNELGSQSGVLRINHGDPE